MRGGAESKLNQIGDILYEACKDRFAEVTSNQRTVQREKGRREKEIIDHLVRRRRQLRKNWRKATPAEKEGLKALWEEVRQRLSRLRRAERIRKRSKRKQKERASFFKDPFKHACSMTATGGEEEWEARNHQGATGTAHQRAVQRSSKERPIRNTWVRASACTL